MYHEVTGREPEFDAAAFCRMVHQSIKGTHGNLLDAYLCSFTGVVDQTFCAAFQVWTDLLYCDTMTFRLTLGEKLGNHTMELDH